MTEYKLVIAEKPSVAKAIASVLGAKKQEDGFLIGNGYIVSWCYGHLAELSDAEIYDEKYGKWRYEDLPILPNPWQYSVTRDKKKQLDLLNSLMHRSDVTEVINACDAGREGELIFRTVYNLNGCTKPMKRLWISSMEDKAISYGFDNLRDGSDYDRLYDAALCRSKADWLVGINATRLFSTLYHRTLNVGRVVSPTLALIVEQEAEINAFEPESFYTVTAGSGDFNPVSERIKDKAEADRLADVCKGGILTVKSVVSTDKSEKAPKLYDLTTLQRDANRILGYTAQQTLDYLQSLYEKKLTTYPRTDSRYLTEDMLGSVNELAVISACILGQEAPISVNINQVCDNKRVSDHHAIIPTLVVEETDLNSLPAGEREILRLIARQLLMAVSSPYMYTETSVTAECEGELFTAKGKKVTNLGWRIYSSQEDKEKSIPTLYEGQELYVNNCEVKEGTTTPPKQYTEDTLLSAMEVAGAKEMPDYYRFHAKSKDFVGEGGATERSETEFVTTQHKGIGTPATRASIIEKLIEVGFVERRKAKKSVSLVPVSAGVSLITVLPEQLQSPLLTAEWEHKLKQIEKGELSKDEFLDEITDMVSELVRDSNVIPGAEILFPSGRPIVGKCPRCGGDVTESKLGYFCERNNCRFGLWRDNKFLTSKRISLTGKMVSALLGEGKTFAGGIYSEKTGKTYDAFILLEDDGEKSTYRLEFSK